jgi:hypothetical protein
MKLYCDLIPHTMFHKGIWLSNKNVPWYFFLKTNRDFEIPNSPTFYESVDECILPTIKKLHSYDIPTTPSCSGHFEDKKYYSDIYNQLRDFEFNLRKGEILHDDENDRKFYYENGNYKLPWQKNEFLSKIIDYQKKGVIGFVDNDGEVYRRLKSQRYKKHFDNGITLILINPTEYVDMEKTWKLIHKDIFNNL